MDARALVEILHASPFFEGLGAEHIEKLTAIATEETWTEGQVVFREGETDDRLYLVLEGLVALDMYVPNRGRTTILTVGPHEVFGWSAAVPVVQKKTASARAILSTRAVGFSAADLIALCDQNHQLGYHVFRRLAHVIATRLTATRLQVIDMYAVERKE